MILIDQKIVNETTINLVNFFTKMILEKEF